MGHGSIQKFDRELLHIGAKLGLSPAEIKQFQEGLENLFDLYFTLTNDTLENGEHEEEGKE